MNNAVNALIRSMDAYLFWEWEQGARRKKGQWRCHGNSPEGNVC